jgi:osmotically inducible protein OsmC
MGMAIRNADAVWKGDLKTGQGTVKVGSGAFESGYSFPSRFENGRGTNPEELMGAAHAACFSMALANVLGKAGNAPQRLETSAVVTFVAGTGITKSALSVRATVPGLDAESFRAAAEDARKNCPVSKALASVPEITLDAQLVS